MRCQEVHKGKLTEKSGVKKGVCQGRLFFLFLFLLAIDWIMKTTTEEIKNVIQWTLWDQLEDFDFADDLTLLSHSNQQIQEKHQDLSSRPLYTPEKGADYQDD